MATVALVPVPGWCGFLRALAVPPAAGEVNRLVLTRAHHGEETAFADVVRHHDHRLRSPAYRLLGDSVYHVLQDVYVTAFRSLPRFRNASALGTWLYRITYNACLDDLQRQPAIAAVAFDADRGASIADPTPSPAESAIGRDDLAAALERLPHDQRAAVMLVDAYGLDYADAAEVLGVRAGTIGSRLSRARTALRATLGGAAA